MSSDIFDKIIGHYLGPYNGGILLLTDDKTFYKNLRAALKSIDPKLDSVHILPAADNRAIRTATNLLSRYSHILFIMESSIAGKNNHRFINILKENFNDRCNIVGLTKDSLPAISAHMFEMGADSVIVKPVSMNDLIHKLALTIKPATKLNKLLAEGRALLRNNEPDKAEAIVRKILSESPGNAEAMLVLGDVHSAKKQFEEAENCYQAASKSSKLFLKPMKRLVGLYENTGQQDKRLSALKVMDKFSPHNHERKIDIGEIYLDKDDEKLAQVYFDNATKAVRRLSADMVSETLMNISAKVKEKNPEMSIKYMKQAINTKDRETSLSSDDLWMLNDLGLTLRKEGKWEESIKCFEKALLLADDDDSAGLFYNIGMAYAQGKSLYRAFNSFQKSLEISPDFVFSSFMIPYNMAKVCMAIGRFEAAEEMASKALELNPEFEQAAVLLKKIDEKAAEKKG